jgi:hypothetical protein
MLLRRESLEPAMSLVGQKHALPQRNRSVRSTPMSGLEAPEGGLCLHGPSGVIDIEHYQINMRLHLYLNRRSLWLGKQNDVRELRQMCGI